ncbi:MAG: glycosyl hydrolase family 28 protein, partial [Bacteroidota bacterium]|nr:glycosyl hydrolase family 28 protein [Bacteroidota bacterium]
ESGAIIQGSGNLKDYNDMGANKSGMVTEGKGALIYFNKADNAHVTGQGVIAMAGTKIKTETGQKIRICNFIECNNSGISDVIIRDSGGFNIHILNSSNITMKGYKIINDLSLPNEDGTDPDGCNGVVVDNVFMYTSDDAIAVKADSRLCQNILVKNCVFWTKKSALKVGSDPYLGARNIVFQNNNVVHADRALALYSGCGGIENVKFIDNKSEFIGGDAKRQLIVFQVSNAKENNSEQNRRGIGFIKNVEVINYTAFQKSENKSIISGTVSSKGIIHKVSNVLFKNMVIEGKHCFNAEDADMVLSPKKLPTDPNARNSVPVEKPDRIMTIENIRFQ